MKNHYPTVIVATINIADSTLNVMIDRKMRKNEKEGVMQRENERIIYHLMHFDEKDKEWSERPYLLLEDMAIVLIFLIWMIDPYKESIIKRQTKNNGRISFYGRVQRRIQNSFCLLNLSLYIKIFEDIPKTDRYLWCQTKYRDMEQV